MTKSTLFLFVALTAVVSVGQAGVVVPSKESNMAFGSAVVSNQEFDYKVINGGVRSSSTTFPKPAVTEAVSSYVIAYKSKAEISQETLMGFATSLREDADAKCNELGAIELAESQAAIPEAKRSRLGYSYRLIAHMDIKLAFDPGKDPGLFACNVTITIQN